MGESIKAERERSAAVSCHYLLTLSTYLAQKGEIRKTERERSTAVSCHYLLTLSTNVIYLPGSKGREKKDRKRERLSTYVS